MKKLFRQGKSAMRRSVGYVGPERLNTLKLIFDAVCAELAIPSDAAVEREFLAIKIMVAGKTVESEMLLVATAMEAIAEYRRKFSTPVAQSMDNSSPEPRAGHDSPTAIHTEA
jgi:hypothetical protein